MADKYRCYGKDDFGHPYDALSMKDEYGEWVRAEDYDAIAAELVMRTKQATDENALYGIAMTRIRALETDQVAMSKKLESTLFELNTANDTLDRLRKSKICRECVAVVATLETKGDASA